MSGWEAARWATRRYGLARVLLPLLALEVACWVAGWYLANLMVCAMYLGWALGWGHGHSFATDSTQLWLIEQLADELDTFDETDLAPDDPRRAELARARAWVESQRARL